MRYATLLVCLCLVLAGCSGTTENVSDTEATQATSTERTTVATTTSETTQTAVVTTEQRFDGDANANVRVYNPTNETWNVTYLIEREGAVVLNETKRIQSGEQWEVVTIDRPGNYTFTVGTDGWTDSVSVRLPRAVGDRESYIEIATVNGEFRLRVRWEQ